MAKVTVRGSLTPCVDLPTGVQKTVEWTPGVRDRIYLYGYYDLVDGPTEDDAPKYATGGLLPEREWNPGDDPILPPMPDSAYPPDATPLEPLEARSTAELAAGLDELAQRIAPPPRNASRDRWASFLSARGIEFADADGRGDLVDLWDKASGVG